MTKLEIDFATDLLYVIYTKAKQFKYADKLVVSLYFTESDLDTLESIIREVVENGVYGNH